MKNFRLKRQLQKAEGSRLEAVELSTLAGAIERANPEIKLTKAEKSQIAQVIGFNRSHSRTERVASFSTAMAIVLVVVMAAQSALPGSALYGVKRSSETVLVHTTPGLKQDDLISRRKMELEQLRQKQAAPARIRQADEDLEQAEDRSHSDAQGRGKNEPQTINKSSGIVPGENDSSDNSGKSSRSGSGKSDSTESGRGGSPEN